MLAIDLPTPVASTGAAATTALPSPARLREVLPLDAVAAATVGAGRAAIRDVLAGRDPRWIVIAGPCSLHDPAETLRYAALLARVAERHRDALVVAMRCYVEKPRTTLGWKGLVHDPGLDGTGDLARGLALSRALMLEIARLGLPVATELLDPIVARYLEDAVAWGSIGARTAHSQTHRELASGHPAPIGVKNAPDGDVQSAIDAVSAARAEHTALSVDPDGRVAALLTPGNDAAHIVLRGGSAGPNHAADVVQSAGDAIARSDAERGVLVDCSHGNSRKDPTRQPTVARELLTDRPSRLAGVLIESNLRPGRQSWSTGERPEPGLSITDACLGWLETKRLIDEVAAAARRALTG